MAGFVRLNAEKCRQIGILIGDLLGLESQALRSSF